MVTDLVGRTGADKTGPPVHRGCPSWSRTAAGMNKGTIGLRCADPCARLEAFPAPRPSTSELALSGAPATTKDLAFRAGLNTHTAATDQARNYSSQTVRPTLYSTHRHLFGGRPFKILQK